MVGFLGQGLLKFRTILQVSMVTIGFVSVFYMLFIACLFHKGQAGFGNVGAYDVLGEVLKLIRLI